VGRPICVFKYSLKWPICNYYVSSSLLRIAIGLPMFVSIDYV